MRPHEIKKNLKPLRNSCKTIIFDFYSGLHGLWHLGDGNTPSPVARLFRAKIGKFYAYDFLPCYYNFTGWLFKESYDGPMKLTCDVYSTEGMKKLLWQSQDISEFVSWSLFSARSYPVHATDIKTLVESVLFILETRLKVTIEKFLLRSSWNLWPRAMRFYEKLVCTFTCSKDCLRQ